MFGEFIEVFTITDLKQKEIESFRIDESLNDSERIYYVLKKGHHSQKLSLVQNLEKYFKKTSNVESFFKLIQEKFLDFDPELQSTIILAFNDMYSVNKITNQFNHEILKLITNEYVNILLVLIVKSVIVDERNEVISY